MSIKNDTQAIELIIPRLPNNQTDLIRLRSQDLCFIPNAVRRFVKRRAKRVATTMNGRIDWAIYDGHHKPDLIRLNMLAINRKLSCFPDEDFS